MRHALLFVGLLGWGCATTEPEAVVDSGLSDTGSPDSTPGDPVDASAHDAALEGDATLADALVDAQVDASDARDAAEAADAYDAGCAYIDFIPFVVKCGGTLTRGTSWVNIAGTTAECPEYFTIAGHQAATEADAVAAASCEGFCDYHAIQAVDLLFCGHRFGYERWEAATDAGSCPSLYTVGSGFYDSFQQYADTHPCPDAGPADSGAD